jgi:hypothetical protein
MTRPMYTYLQLPQALPRLRAPEDCLEDEDAIEGEPEDIERVVFSTESGVETDKALSRRETVMKGDRLVEEICRGGGNRSAFLRRPLYVSTRNYPGCSRALCCADLLAHIMTSRSGHRRQGAPAVFLQVRSSLSPVRVRATCTSGSDQVWILS